MGTGSMAQPAAPIVTEATTKQEMIFLTCCAELEITLRNGKNETENEDTRRRMVR
jgi:hypothetical protein